MKSASFLGIGGFCCPLVCTVSPWFVSCMLGYDFVDALESLNHAHKCGVCWCCACERCHFGPLESHSWRCQYLRFYWVGPAQEEHHQGSWQFCPEKKRLWASWGKVGFTCGLASFSWLLSWSLSGGAALSLLETLSGGTSLHLFLPRSIWALDHNWSSWGILGFSRALAKLATLLRLFGALSGKISLHWASLISLAPLRHFVVPEFGGLVLSLFGVLSLDLTLSGWAALCLSGASMLALSTWGEMALRRFMLLKWFCSGWAALSLSIALLGGNFTLLSISDVHRVTGPFLSIRRHFGTFWSPDEFSLLGTGVAPFRWRGTEALWVAALLGRVRWNFTAFVLTEVHWGTLDHCQTSAGIWDFLEPWQSWPHWCGYLEPCQAKFHFIGHCWSHWHHWGALGHWVGHARKEQH